MMKNNFPVFIDEIRKAVLEGGELALSAQGGVKNIGKEAERLEHDTPEAVQKRSTKTVIDEQVQELILRAVVRMGESANLFLDAEEETPSVALFTNQDTRASLVIDPIDGTFEYLQGKDCYSVSVGLLEDGKVLVAFVYFPARQELYSLEADGLAYRTVYRDSHEVKEKKELHMPSVVQKNIVYLNKRVPDDIVDCLTGSGYMVRDDISAEGVWSGAMLKCMAGEYIACLFHTPQIRDILLGAILANVSEGYVTDWGGKPLVWPKSGRVPRVMFGVGSLSEKILACLNAAVPTR